MGHQTLGQTTSPPTQTKSDKLLKGGAGGAIQLSERIKTIPPDSETSLYEQIGGGEGVTSNFGVNFLRSTHFYEFLKFIVWGGTIKNFHV